MKFLLALSFFLATLTSYSQTSKKALKAIKTYRKGKVDKGIDQMHAAVKADPSPQNYDILVSMELQRYEESKNSLANQLLAALMAVDKKQDQTIYLDGNANSEVYFNSFVNTCREANLNSQSVRAPMYLRNFFIDYPIDTALSDTAKSAFSDAEGAFREKNYGAAKEHYRRAIDLHPGYYKATLYLGDAFWMLEELDSAISYYTEAMNMAPDLLEPHKYLADAYADFDDAKSAKTHCLKALCIYPDQIMFSKYGSVLSREGKVLNQHWTRRMCPVNHMKANYAQVGDPNWSVYQAAKAEIEAYCDSNGVINQKNSLTDANYLEVYSWEKMLKGASSFPGELGFAKRMMDEGYLDCYVFLSAFHFDTYQQYAHFVKGNEDKVRRYFERYLIE